MPSDRIVLHVTSDDAIREVAVSSPNRVVFGQVGVTKLELIEYMRSVSVPFLEHSGFRPVSLERFRDGIEGGGFFSKNPPKGTPDFVASVDVTYNSGRVHPQLVLTEEAAIVWAMQMNTVVFHPWASRASDSDNPVELRIDLDPQPGTTFADAAYAAHGMREVLAEVGLTSFLKTSGNRGIHLFAPIHPDHEFLEVRHAVIAAGRELERRMPDRVTTAWWKEERGERIFIDYNQANRDRTMAGAYSVRALPTATVSTPITWDELDDCDPLAFTVRTVPERFHTIGDPWHDMASAAGSIDALLGWWQRDIEDGLGELAFPPEFPKMPGEPPRVQPSRAKKWGGELMLPAP